MQKVYSIKDVKSEIFSQPFFSRNAASAIRAVEMHVNSGKVEDPMVKYPEDFALYEIGEWNDETGALVPAEVPLKLAVLATLKRNVA